MDTPFDPDALINEMASAGQSGPSTAGASPTTGTGAWDRFEAARRDGLSQDDAVRRAAGPSLGEGSSHRTAGKKTSRKGEILSSRQRPPRAAVYPEGIPAELKARARWVCWRWDWRPEKRGSDKGKWTKIPVNPTTGRNADSTKASTWGTFDEAIAAYTASKIDVKERGKKVGETPVDGVGYVLGDGHFGFDGDECVEVDERTGEVTFSDFTRGIVSRLNTYTEFSPTGTGVKGIARGDLTAALGGKTGFNRNDLGLEVYTAGRFFTITGQLIPGSPTEIADGQAAGESLVAEFRQAEEPRPQPTAKPQPLGMADQEVLDRMFASAKGAKLRRLYNGDWSEYPSQSQADLALVNNLCWWFRKDDAAVDRVFRDSGLYRAKWDRKDYRERTIAKGMAAVKGNGYEPQGLTKVRITWGKKLIAESGSRSQSDPASDGREPSSQETPSANGPITTDGTFTPPGQNGDNLRDEQSTGAADDQPETPAPPDPGGEGRTTESDDQLPVLESVTDPYRLARVYLRQFAHDDRSRLLYYRSEWFAWASGWYEPIEEEAVKAGVWTAVREDFERIARKQTEQWAREADKDENGRPKGKPPTVLQVKRDLVGNILGALKSLSIVTADHAPPSWLDDGSGSEHHPTDLIACPNGIVVLPLLVANDHDHLLVPTPRYFTHNALPFRFNAAAPEPKNWLAFLHQLWNDDPESIDTLQEWFGYCLTPDTSFQKAIMMIGPRRSGKGTICKVLKGIVGERNTASINLGSLAGDFGLWPLLEKSLAIVPDCRLTDKYAGDAHIVEQFLSITGEDDVTVNRKGISQVITKLRTRFTLCANEVPRLKDPALALPGRLIILRMMKTFFGCEDRTLYDQKLEPELPSILIWAIVGWQRLQNRGRFVQPDSGLELVRAMEALASQVVVFIREECLVGRDHQVGKEELYKAYRGWADRSGFKAMSKPVFGKELFAAESSIRESRAGADDEGKRSWMYEGIGLRP
jgi:putative DNA primase/helicase